MYYIKKFTFCFVVPYYSRNKLILLVIKKKLCCACVDQCMVSNQDACQMSDEP